MNDQQTFLNYFVLAFVVHLMVLITLTTVHFTSDVTKSGDLGMDVQIFIMKQEINPVEETNIAESIKKKIEEKVDEQQVIMDNRKAGDKTVQTFDTWHGRVRQIIDSNKSYPLLSRQRKEEGTAVVKFTILKNGKVQNLTVRSSGYRGLDREARRMIITSIPFPAIPSAANKESITLTVPINFSLEKIN